MNMRGRRTLYIQGGSLSAGLTRFRLKNTRMCVLIFLFFFNILDTRVRYFRYNMSIRLGIRYQCLVFFLKIVANLFDKCNYISYILYLTFLFFLLITILLYYNNVLKCFFLFVWNFKIKISVLSIC